MRFSVVEDLNPINNHQIQNLKFSIFEIGFIRKPHCNLSIDWSNFETSKNKKVNFDPNNFSKKIFFSYFMFKYNNQRLQISVSRKIHLNLLPLPSPSARGHVEK